MKLKLTNPNYCATVVRLDKFVDLANCDNVKGAIIYGQQVIVGKDAQEGDLGLFFPGECQIDEQFLFYNNLYDHENLNADQTKKGYFEDNGRVKVKKFRGHRSEGFFAPISFLNYFGAGKELLEHLREGVSFNEIDDEVVCRKYVRKVNPAPLFKNSKLGVKRKSYADMIVDGQFNFHYDTANLRRSLDTIRPRQVFSVSQKFHGSSAIIGRLLIKPELLWYEKILHWFGVEIPSSYGTVWASRNVIKGVNKPIAKDGGYYGEDIWGVWAQQIGPKLPDGFTVYGEIVGWTPGGREIQKGYTYGLPKGQSEFYCYRVTHTNAAGYTIELTTPQVVEFCERLGIKTVPIISQYVSFVSEVVEDFEAQRDAFVKYLETNYVDVKCKWNPGLPAEGVVLKLEGLNKSRALKLKSFEFLALESKNLDKGVPDLEEEQQLDESVSDNS